MPRRVLEFPWISKVPSNPHLTLVIWYLGRWHKMTLLFRLEAYMYESKFCSLSQMSALRQICKTLLRSSLQKTENPSYPWEKMKVIFIPLKILEPFHKSILVMHRYWIVEIEKVEIFDIFYRISKYSHTLHFAVCIHGIWSHITCFVPIPRSKGYISKEIRFLPGLRIIFSILTAEFPADSGKSNFVKICWELRGKLGKNKAM